ncbi:MAG: beta-propeller domain-containing protein, partial [Burkholderiales bacterium]|nr:beta-propeller domain-containing protein [Burkholderiales bacterium]
MLRILLVLLLAACTCAQAAAPLVADRSPIRPGLWWDPARAGSGFDLHVAPGQVFAVWYTYRADGTPVWYTAQGPMDAGGAMTGSLLQHRWRDGAYAGNAEVGTLTLRRTSTEALAAQWRLGTEQGEWNLAAQPLPGNLPEVDHSGSWFEPARAGYGLGLNQQGDWLAGALYAYDAQGEPTWLFGTNEGAGQTLTLGRYRGSCPACAWSRSRSDGSLRATVSFGAESALALDIVDGAGLLPPAWRLQAQPLVMATMPASARAADRQLARFVDGAAADAWLREALALGVRGMSSSMVDFSPPPVNAAVSQTNLVEADVDESDRIKSDGRYIYTFTADERAQPQRSLRIAAIRADGSGIDVLPNVPLADAANPVSPSLAALYLTPTRLIVLTGSRATGINFGGWGFVPPEGWGKGLVDLEIYDVATDPAQPRALWRARFDGHLVSSRRIGDLLYLVQRWAPDVPGLRTGDLSGVSAPNVEFNRGVLAGVDPATLWPGWRVGDAAAQALVDPAALLLPPQVSRVATPEFSLVTAIDLARLQRRDSLAVAGAVEAVYASPANLYLATSPYQPRIDFSLGLEWDTGSSIDVHRIPLAGSSLAADASGSVEGYLDRNPERAPFRLSEHEGRLRLVTVGDFGARGFNRLSVLEPSTIAPGRLRTLASLPNAARPEPLGKPNEQLYATRFVGDRLYAVTFLGIDPLYVVELAPAADPRIAGAVELPGYSEYLHPLPDGLLLGFGKDAVPATGSGDGRWAWYQGLKFTLFDVSDATRPRVQQEIAIGRRGSDSPLLSDHHALAVLAPQGAPPRYAIPVRVHEASDIAPPSPSPSFIYPWSYTGLASFELTGRGAGRIPRTRACGAPMRARCCCPMA